jgi:MFS family permease
MLLMRVFVPLALGYYVSYVFRNVNAAIFRDLVADLGLGASALGLLTSAYFVVFALVQLPIGLLLDRFGPRRINAGLFVLASLGALGFAFGRTVGELVAARAVIGLGVSAGLMAAMKGFSLWFPVARLPMLNGSLMAVGGIGAMTATAPATWFVDLYGWRDLFITLAALTLAIAAIQFWALPERRTAGAPPTARSLVLGLRRVLGDGYFWPVSAVSFVTLGPAIALQGLWVGPWLQDVQGVDKEVAAGLLFYLTIALTAGFLVCAKLAVWGARLGLGVRDMFILCALSSALTLAAIAAGLGGTVLWALYIFLSAGATLAYTVLAEYFPLDLLGRVNSSLNMVTFVTAFATQFGIGKVLDAWGAEAGRYPAAAYSTGFWAVVAVQLAALLWLGVRLRRGRPARAVATVPAREGIE